MLRSSWMILLSLLVFNCTPCKNAYAKCYFYLTKDSVNDSTTRVSQYRTKKLIQQIKDILPSDILAMSAPMEVPMTLPVELTYRTCRISPIISIKSVGYTTVDDDEYYFDFSVTYFVSVDGKSYGLGNEILRSYPISRVSRTMTRDSIAKLSIEISRKCLDITLGKLMKLESQTIDDYAIVIGSELGYPRGANKMMFFGQAIYHVKSLLKTQAESQHERRISLLYSKHGYNEEEITTVRQTINHINPSVPITLYELTKAEDLARYFNDPINENSDRKVKIKHVAFFAHGIPGSINLAMAIVDPSHSDNSIDQTMRFDRKSVAGLAEHNFHPNAEIFSYACRSGLGELTANEEKYIPYGLKYSTPGQDIGKTNPRDIDPEVGPAVATGIMIGDAWRGTTVTKGFSSADERAEFISQNKDDIRSPELFDAFKGYNLAQDLANKTGSAVYAYLIRTDYRETWGRDRQLTYPKIEIPDPLVSGKTALWVMSGAVNFLTTVEGPDRRLWLFRRGKSPIAVTS